jgi:O-antigen/teichoic acid export membrane protein
LSQSSTLSRNLRAFVGGIAVYGIGNILLRGINVLTLPLYTRYLTPGDYGIIGIALVFSALLNVIYPLGYHGALTRFYVSSKSDAERRQCVGTIWLSLLATSVVGAIIVDSIGGFVFPFFFPNIPFSPYIRLAIWTSFFNVFSLVPLQLLQIQERAGWYVAASVCASLTATIAVIGLVVFSRLGAYGYLLGNCVGAFLAAIPYFVFTIRNAETRINWGVLRQTTTYALPLVPHLVASWGLAFSDRLVLERFVSLAQVGLYSLAYQVSSVMNLVASSMNNTWIPIVFKKEASEGPAAGEELVQLVSYYIFALTWIGLGLSLLLKDAVVLVTAPAFHPSQIAVPWLVAGMWLMAVYSIPANFLFLKSQTYWLPFLTCASAVTNIIFNFLFIPHFGIRAAAWGSCVGSGTQLLLTWNVAQRAFKLPYDYKRLFQSVSIAVVIFFIGNSLTFQPLSVQVTLHVLLCFAFPIILVMVGVHTAKDKEIAFDLWRNVFARRSGISL